MAVEQHSRRLAARLHPVRRAVQDRAAGAPPKTSVSFNQRTIGQVGADQADPSEGSAAVGGRETARGGWRSVMRRCRRGCRAWIRSWICFFSELQHFFFRMRHHRRMGTTRRRGVTRNQPAGQGADRHRHRCSLHSCSRNGAHAKDVGRWATGPQTTKALPAERGKPTGGARAQAAAAAAEPGRTSAGHPKRGRALSGRGLSGAQPPPGARRHKHGGRRSQGADPTTDGAYKGEGSLLPPSAGGPTSTGGVKPQKRRLAHHCQPRKTVTQFSRRK